MAKVKSGGGLGMSKVVRAKAPKVEPKSRAINPGGADQLGQAMALKRAVTPLEAGPGYSTPVGPTSGMVNGPKGQGRELHRCGSQGFHGAASQGQPTEPKQITTELPKSIPLDQKRTNRTI
jgi:hypothetical protein